jgi:hypothetical protein
MPVCELCGKPSQIWDGLFKMHWCGDACLAAVLAEVERLEKEQFGMTVYEAVRSLNGDTS